MQLICGDAIEEMQKLPEHSVDLVLTDPPYGVTACKWDIVIPMDAMWRALRRIIKPGGVIALFCQMPFSAELVHSNLTDFKYQLTWYKHSARNFLNAKKQPMRVCENIVIFAGKQSTYNPQMIQGRYAIRKNKGKRLSVYGVVGACVTEGNEYYPNDLLDFPSVKTAERVHPTQKPVDLLRYLIRTYSNAGETVLDFTMGSGSTGVAAHAEGREFIGIELDPQMYAVACREIEKAQNQVRMEDMIDATPERGEQTKLF